MSGWGSGPVKNRASCIDQPGKRSRASAGTPSSPAMTLTGKGLAKVSTTSKGMPVCWGSVSRVAASRRMSSARGARAAGVNGGLTARRSAVCLAPSEWMRPGWPKW